MSNNKALNFSREIIDLITDDWWDDKNLVMSALFYLYQTTTDNKMKYQIEDIFNEEKYCIHCGSPMQYYEYQEPHTELNPVQYEIIGNYICPNCSREN